MFGGGGGQRCRGIDPRAGAFLWNLWAEADAGTDSGNRALSPVGGAFCAAWGGGADGADGGRFEVAVRSNAGAGWGGSIGGAGAGAVARVFGDRRVCPSLHDSGGCGRPQTSDGAELASVSEDRLFRG